MRIDSTVVEADVRYPSDAALAHAAARTLAREARRVVGDGSRPVRDRSRAVARRLRLIARTAARRSGQAKDAVLRLTGEAGSLVERSLREARRLLQSDLGEQQRQRLQGVVEVAERIASQIRQRLRGERIVDRVVSLADPDARPIRKGKLGKPTEFGYVTQLAEITEHTRRGVRGFLLPPPLRIGSPNETELLPATVAELDRLQLRLREAARRRRVPDRHHRRAPRRTRAAAPHRRAPHAAIPPRTPPRGLLPRRLRSPHRLPQTPLRPPPHPTPRRHRSPHLDGLGGPGLTTPTPSDSACADRGPAPDPQRRPNPAYSYSPRPQTRLRRQFLRGE